MDRRLFLTAIFGTIVATGFAGIATAKADSAQGRDGVPTDLAERLDQVEASFSQSAPNRRQRTRREPPSGSVDRRHWKHHHTRRRHNQFDRGRI